MKVGPHIRINIVVAYLYLTCLGHIPYFRKNKLWYHHHHHNGV
jgi:hypothetical protein